MIGVSSLLMSPLPLTWVCARKLAPDGGWLLKDQPCGQRVEALSQPNLQECWEAGDWMKPQQKHQRSFLVGEHIHTPSEKDTDSMGRGHWKLLVQDSPDYPMWFYIWLVLISILDNKTAIINIALYWVLWVILMNYQFMGTPKFVTSY